MTNRAELIEKLRKEDELTLLELLDITSEDLVDMFLDEIENNLGRIYRYYDDRD